MRRGTACGELSEVLSISVRDSGFDAGGFGGLKVIDEDYMAEQCSPTRADLACVDDELFNLARLPLEACMRSRGFEPR